MILLVTDKIVIPLQLLQSVIFPFCGSLAMSPNFQFLGAVSEVQMFLYVGEYSMGLLFHRLQQLGLSIPDAFQFSDSICDLFYSWLFNVNVYYR